MATTPTPKTQKEADVLALLDSPLLNLAPIIEAVYPNEPRSTASSKFSAKKTLKRYQRFSPDEQDAILKALDEQLQHLLERTRQVVAAEATT